MPTGVPQLIISMSIAHIAFIASMSVPSAGIITHFIPLSVMVHVMWHIIGIIDAMGIDRGVDIGICIAGFIIVVSLYMTEWNIDIPDGDQCKAIPAAA